jgi:hypothetical protein
MVDLYTKSILTVIAIALVAIVIRGGVAPTYAAGGIQRVTICNEDGSSCLPLYSGGFQGGKIGITVFSP